ncbi:MAG: BrnT family toxin [Acidobacteria bacterium]|uniref:BrnT family toxin n=1 Tax=Candidatus Polarisedimenticola svalbardensis TaxID=2886004 RepID=A0A8J6Y0A1_9BACT|nr:BrnT family toxin [Candidatus Polarisedimenticola svalbardensis]
MPLEFTWDRAKAASNLAKHGVPFEEASTTFGDPLSITVTDRERRTYE